MFRHFKRSFFEVANFAIITDKLVAEMHRGPIISNLSKATGSLATAQI